MRALGIVFSGRVRTVLLTLLGLWVVFVLASMTMEVFGAYLAGSGFDTPLNGFWIISLAFFAPYFITVAYMLRALAARLAFYRLIKRQIVIAEYQPPAVLTPLEAGLMIDNVFGLPELAAVLKQLELDGFIAIHDEPLALTLTLLKTDGMTAPKRLFIEELFAGSSSNVLSIDSTTKTRLLSAGNSLAASTRNKLVATGELATIPWLARALNVLFKVFLAMALLVQGVWTASLVSNPTGALSVGYPRYPMNASEPLFMAGLLFGMALLIASGFYQKTLTSSQGIKNWRYVAGLRVYIEVVYKGRFFRDGVQTTTSPELRQFYPYAIALGVEAGFTKRLARALVLS